MLHRFDSDGVEIAFHDEGEGEPVVLIHGFASNHRVNWIETSWSADLRAEGRRVIAFDNRGHGASQKLYDPAVYGADEMAQDARRLLDHLGIERADLIGYSMGARICAFMAIGHPERVRSAVFGGLGINMVRGMGAPGPIAAALEAASADAVVDASARSFRVFAERTGSDLAALAACIRATRRRITAEELARIAAPVLVVVGSRDPIGGSPEGLAELIPGGRALKVADRDHMSTVGSKQFKAAALAFLKERP
jgi:pimeloyl-ACP methyl ester carboxylesterase